MPWTQPIRIIPMSAPLKSKRKKKLRTKLPQECAWCGATQDLTIDHITPRCFGGTNEQHNLQTLCAPCNTQKSHREQPRRARPAPDPTVPVQEMSQAPGVVSQAGPARGRKTVAPTDW